MITWEPWAGGGSLNNPRWSLRAILRGDHDPYIRSWTRAVATWGRSIYVRPMHEMNGDWTPWSPGVNGNTAAEFRAAWRRIVTIARNQGADNIRWVWCPNVAYQGSTPFSSVWPGAGYVDWMCLDGYNWGTTQRNTSWQPMRSTFGPSVTSLASLSAKPIMVGETASSDKGGNKAAWILNGFNALPDAMPQIRAVLWFNKAQDGADWPVDTSSASLQAFRTVAALPVYSGRLP
jgi:beta-mannanase